MVVRIYENYETLSEQAAQLLVEQVKSNPFSNIVLAAGDSPRLTYQLFVRKLLEQHIDYRNCHFIGLDEWLDVAPENTGSCHYFLKTNIIEPLSVPATHFHLFNALTSNQDEECERMDSVVRELNGIDAMVVGIGMNGHIGFNEPGVPFDLYAHVVDLDENTQAVGQKYFNAPTTLRSGISLGMKHLMESKKVFALASGKKKSTIIARLLKEEINNRVPASILRQHKNSWLLLDEDAASDISQPSTK